MYKITTYQGLTFTMGESFDIAEYFELLNSNIDSVAISEVSTLKHNIQKIEPIYEEEPTEKKLLIYTTRGDEAMVSYSDDYDAGSVTQQVNSTKRQAFIRIGNVVINRNEYSLVMPEQNV